MSIIDVRLNPNDMGSGNVLSNGNLTVTNTSSTAIRATPGRVSGKWYWEAKLISLSGQVLIGIANKQMPLSSANLGDVNQRTYYGSDGTRRPENTPYGTRWTTGDVLGIALNLDNDTLEFYKNGVSMGVSHTNIKELGEVYPVLRGVNSATNTVTFNFGASPFEYTIPNKYYSYDGRQDGWYYKFLISSEDKNIHSIKPEIKFEETAIPNMTSDTSPSGRVLASSINSVSTDAWQAFSATGQWMSSVAGYPHYLGYEFTEKKRIYGYSMKFNSTSRPVDWTFEGSTDGTNYTVLDTRKNQTTNNSTDFFYINDDVENFRIYRINITSGTHSSQVSIQLLKMFEYIPSELVKLESASENNFISYGLNKDQTINMSQKMFNRNYIVENGDSLSSGKVFKQAIDTVKTPIRNVTIETNR
ncbi:hypothetical protein EBB07_29650 [Paenibacillaceae bacterium]|nr:hypothetical protein EBB07_29650 [Paenibacillaceae bacterium]